MSVSQKKNNKKTILLTLVCFLAFILAILISFYITRTQKNQSEIRSKASNEEPPEEFNTVENTPQQSCSDEILTLYGVEKKDNIDIERKRVKDEIEKGAREEFGYNYENISDFWNSYSDILPEIDAIGESLKEGKGDVGLIVIPRKPPCPTVVPIPTITEETDQITNNALAVGITISAQDALKLEERLRQQVIAYLIKNSKEINVIRAQEALRFIEGDRVLMSKNVIDVLTAESSSEDAKIILQTIRIWGFRRFDSATAREFVWQLKQFDDKRAVGDLFTRLRRKVLFRNNLDGGIFAPDVGRIPTNNGSFSINLKILDIEQRKVGQRMVATIIKADDLSFLKKIMPELTDDMVIAGIKKALAASRIDLNQPIIVEAAKSNATLVIKGMLELEKNPPMFSRIKPGDFSENTSVVAEDGEIFLSERLIETAEMKGISAGGVKQQTSAEFARKFQAAATLEENGFKDWIKSVLKMENVKPLQQNPLTTTHHFTIGDVEKLDLGFVAEKGEETAALAKKRAFSLTPVLQKLGWAMIFWDIFQNTSNMIENLGSFYFGSHLFLPMDMYSLPSDPSNPNSIIRKNIIQIPHGVLPSRNDICFNTKNVCSRQFFQQLEKIKDDGQQSFYETGKNNEEMNVLNPFFDNNLVNLIEDNVDFEIPVNDPYRKSIANNFNALIGEWFGYKNLSGTGKCYDWLAGLQGKKGEIECNYHPDTPLAYYLYSIDRPENLVTDLQIGDNSRLDGAIVYTYPMPFQDISISGFPRREDLIFMRFSLLLYNEDGKIANNVNLWQETVSPVPARIKISVTTKKVVTIPVLVEVKSKDFTFPNSGIGVSEKEKNKLSDYKKSLYLRISMDTNNIDKISVDDIKNFNQEDN